MVTPIIHTEKLTHRFGDALAVDRLSLAIQPGEIFGFLGHNGAGKTTTVRLLNGVLIPTAGQMEVLGLDPVTQGAQVRQRTGVLTETPALDDRLTARESLRFYADLFGVPPGQVAGRIEELLTTLGLSERGDDKIGGYSKGMRQRLALARTLIHDPEIIFLDEPTSGLDPVAARDIHHLIAQLSRGRGRTVLLCTHNLVEAQRLCNRVAVLAQGQLLAVGSPLELMRQFGNRQRLRLSVEATQVAQALQLINAFQPNRISAQQSDADAGVILVGGIAQETIPHLIRALVAADIALYSVVPDEPSLEEVYLALQIPNP